MKRYIQHPQTGKLIPRDEYQLESRKTSWQVLPDIQPYISQIDGHIVPSRNAHRAHLRINGCVEVGELQPQNVTAGDIVLIPPMCRQRITNIGATDLVFLAICSPRFSNEKYEDIDA